MLHNNYYKKKKTKKKLLFTNTIFSKPSRSANGAMAVGRFALGFAPLVVFYYFCTPFILISVDSFIY